MKPSTSAVLRLLRARGKDGLSPAEAHHALACDRLAARVHELKAAGYVVQTIMERAPNGAVYARYRLIEPQFTPVTGQQEGWL